MYRFCSIIILLIWSQFSMAGDLNEEAKNFCGAVEGLIIDKQTKQPISGANIQIVNTTLGAASDREGHFKIENIPVGEYKIAVSMIGYSTEIKTDMAVKSNRTLKLTFELNTQIIESDQTVTVVADYFDKGNLIGPYL